jgi:hypothetical protein
MKQLSLFLLLSLLVGCKTPEQASQARTAPHTHLWTSTPKVNIWTYQKVKSISSSAIGDTVYVSRLLLPGDTVILENGVTVSFRNSAVWIDAESIPEGTLNVVIFADGTWSRNAFIRTFQ